MQIQWKDEWTLPAAVGGVSFLLGVGAGVAGKIFRDKRKYTILEVAATPVSMEQLDDKLGEVNHAIDRLSAVKSNLLKEQVDAMGYSSPAVAEEVVKEEAFIPQPEAVVTEPLPGVITEPEEDEEEYDDEDEEVLDLSAEEALEYYANRPAAPNGGDPKVERVSIFRHNDDTWDQKAEERKRDSKKPYIISKDEFFEEGEIDFRQSQLTFYEGDQTLVDEYDTVVDQKMVGVLLFGHGSGDPNVCYVRNMGQLAEYEIVKDENHFVLQQMADEMERTGERAELRHSAVPHFRRD